MNEFSRLQSLQTLAPIDPSHDLDIQQWLTDEGARVLFVQATELPMFDIRLSFDAGSCRDDEQNGAAFVTMSMLNEGAPGLDAEQIAGIFEGAGATFQAYLGVDHAVISLRCLSAVTQREAAVNMLAQAVGTPTFDETALAQVKRLCTDFVAARERSPRYKLQRYIYRHLYASHPYGHLRHGDPAGIASLTRDQLATFHARHYRAANASISLVGDLDLAQARSIAAQISASLPTGPGLAAIPYPAISEPEVLHVDTETGQLQVMLVLPSVLRQSGDYAALVLANEIFGDGTHSRLHHELRTRRGLSYSFGSSFAYGLADSKWFIHWQCANSYNRSSQDLVERLLKDYITNGPTEEEVSQARQRILRSSPLRIATNAAILGQLANINVFGLPLDSIEQFNSRIAALTLAEVHQAMVRNLRPQEMLYASIGPDVPQLPLPALP